MNTQEIAHRLVELCRAGEGPKAVDELYAENAVSIEPEGAVGFERVRGLAAMREKSRQFDSMIEAVHGGSVGDPIVSGHWFSVTMGLDVTMKGRGRVSLNEICVYGVRNGKIVHEQFFYDVG